MILMDLGFSSFDEIFQQMRRKVLSALYIFRPWAYNVHKEREENEFRECEQQPAS